MKRLRRNGLYLRRVWWWFPWGLTRPWQPGVFLGGDEWCNVPVCFAVPALGCFLIFWRFWRPLRTMPCTECWLSMDDEQRAGYLPGGVYYGGR